MEQSYKVLQLDLNDALTFNPNNYPGNLFIPDSYDNLPAQY